MDIKDFNKAMELIVSALKEREYDPYWQIYGYLEKNEPTYITSHKGARELIKTLDPKAIKDYIEEYLK